MSEQLSTLQITGYLLGSGFFGSLLTLGITRYLDNKKEKNQRKLWIFRALVTNLQNRLNFDFVSAINLVQIDFSNDKKVIDTWEKCREALNIDFKQSRAEQELEILSKKINNSLADLVKTIGANLGYKQDKLDILDKSYSPQRWFDDESHIRKKEQLLMEILENKRPLDFRLTPVQNNTSPHQAASQLSATLPQGESD
jgi:hypothetical protein